MCSFVKGQAIDILYHKHIFDLITPQPLRNKLLDPARLKRHVKVLH